MLNFGFGEQFSLNGVILSVNSLKGYLCIIQFFCKFCVVRISLYNTKHTILIETHDAVHMHDVCDVCTYQSPMQVYPNSQSWFAFHLSYLIFVTKFAIFCPYCPYFACVLRVCVCLMFIILNYKFVWFVIQRLFSCNMKIINFFLFFFSSFDGRGATVWFLFFQ